MKALRKVLFGVSVLLLSSQVFGQTFIRGDYSQDGVFNIIDLISYAQALNDVQPMQLECYDTADVNDDGRITLEDVVFLATALFGGGELPPEPFPDPGPDPTPDPISCDSIGFFPPEPDPGYVLSFPHYEITTGRNNVSVDLIFERGVHEIYSCSAAINYPSEYLSVINVEQIAFPNALFGFKDHGNGLLTVTAQSIRGQLEEGMGDPVPPGPMVHIEFAVKDVPAGTSMTLDFLPWSEKSPYSNLQTYTGVGVNGRFIPAATLSGVVDVVEAGEEFIRGDVNGDQQVNLTDAARLLNWLYFSDAPPVCNDAADIDDDGNITYADVLFLNRFLFVGNAEIPAPYPEEGVDLTDDLITCTAYEWPDNINPVEPLVRISFECAAGLPGETVRVPVKLRNLVPLQALTLVFKWDPAQLSFLGMARDGAGVIAEVRDADTFEPETNAALGSGVVRIGFEKTQGFVNAIAPNNRDSILGYAEFVISEDMGDEPFALVEIPYRLCRNNESCVYTSAVGENGEAIQMRTVPITISRLMPTAGGGIVGIQKTVVPVDGVEDEPLAEVTAVSEFNTETGEGILTFPELPDIVEPEGVKGKDDPGFPFCFFPAQVGSSLLRSIAFVHGFQMPGTGNLAALTDANSILLQVVEEYPIENPRDKRKPFNPLGRSTIMLEVSTSSPTIKSIAMDLSELDWEKLPCPPAPYTFEWSALDTQTQLLTEHTGDYYLGWDRVLSAGMTQSFYNFKRISTKCIPISGAFSHVPDQVVMVSGNYDPDNGSVHFTTAIIENDHKQFVRGDANGSGVVDLADPIHVLDYLFNHVDLKNLPDAADANDDGAIDLADAITLLAYTMLIENPDMLRAPFWRMDPLSREKGMDPTQDSL